MFCPRCHRTYEDDSAHCHYDGQALLERPTIDAIPAGSTRLAGTVVDDRYEIRGFLGKGGMARIYLALDLTRQWPVAVKMLDRARAADRGVRQRFYREVRAIQTIDHPNVVKVFDVGEDRDGLPHIVMEFLFGESLGSLFRREGRLPAGLAVPVLRQTASALAAAHAAGVIHRDVKPDNIFLLGEPGEPYGVKVLDFGFAKLEQGSGATSSGITVGTVGYMAPEQVVTDRTDEATDVYGLGVVAFRIVTGTLPFDSPDQTTLLAAQLALAPPRPSSRAEGLDPRLEAIVLKAMAKDPQERYRAMAELAWDLDVLLGDADGDMWADRFPPSGSPYQPNNLFARQAAVFFYKHLGLPIPRHWTPTAD